MLAPQERTERAERLATIGFGQQRALLARRERPPTDARDDLGIGARRTCGQIRHRRLENFGHGGDYLYSKLLRPGVSRHIGTGGGTMPVEYSLGKQGAEKL